MSWSVITSSAWPYRLLRIGVLSLLGWWLVKTCCLPGFAWFQPEDEWALTDFSRHTVALDEIIDGGPPKDGIPSIDQPRFVAVDTASRWLTPNEPVIVLNHGGDSRAYPLQILVYHEIVNDEIGDTPVTVTFCPLCYSSIVFDRRVRDRLLDFGTTGKIRKSDLVMYDRQTESWWQQFTGKGIVGHYAGTELKRLPSTIASFASFRTHYPAGQVLSRNTGFIRSYGNNPYIGYDDINKTPFLFDDPLDTRLPPMEKILAVQIDGLQRIYPFSELGEQRVINDILGKQPVVIISKQDVLSALDAATLADSRLTLAAAAYSRNTAGKTLTFRQNGHHITDRETGSDWNLYGKAVGGPLEGNQLQTLDSGIYFAFAWLAFRPESEIYRSSQK